MTAHVHVIAHTHWDREWYLTREQYRARLVDLVDRVLDRMTAEPSFTYFHLDGQTIVLEDYLELRPERESELRSRIGEGRLLVGPWYVMPDMFLVSGEALVRNLARGIRRAAAFGAVMRVGYMPDPFGHVAQMPQILAGTHLDGAILWRGLAGEAAEYMWEAPDGSRVVLAHLPREGYCNGLRLPLAASGAIASEAERVVARERERSAIDHVLLMVGVDHVEPHPALLQLIAALKGLPGVASAELTTLPAYVAAISTASSGTRLRTICGELRGGENLAHLLPGVLSARTYLKQANARVQRKLERWAEPLSALAAISGAACPTAQLAYAWRVLLENHPHDSICGCSIDAVHDENLVRFARAEQVADLITDRAVADLSAHLPAAATDTLRMIAVNTDITPWSGVLDATIDIPLEIAGRDQQEDGPILEQPLQLFKAGARIAQVLDHRSRALANQVLGVSNAITHRMSRYLPPVPVRVQRVRLAVLMEDVPSLGYGCMDVQVASDEANPAVTANAGHRDGNEIENDLVRVTARDDGTIDVLDKRSAITYPQVFAIEDVGDVGDEYNFCPPANDRHITNADARGVLVTSIARGPLVNSLRVEYTLAVPAAAAADRSSRSEKMAILDLSIDVEVRAGSPAVRAVIRCANTAKDHRLRVLVPTAAAIVSSHRADTAFGVVERPFPKSTPQGPLVETPVESAPMQSLVDAGDSGVGAVVVADGLPEYELLPTPAGVATAVTLLRSVGDLSRDDLATRRGHAGPGLATPGAQCPGDHAFHLAFVPRAYPPPAGTLFRIAREILTPPRVFGATGGDGRLPPSMSFIRVESAGAENIVLSAVKCADDGQHPELVLRLFNAGDCTEAVVLSSAAPIARAELTDLLEEPQAECPAEGNTLKFTLGPHRIQTVKAAIAQR
jgi:alpha-mannosidase